MITEHRSKAAVGQNPSFCLSFGFNLSRCIHSRSLSFPQSRASRSPHSPPQLDVPPPHRFESWSKPLARFTMYRNAVIATAETISNTKD